MSKKGTGKLILGAGLGAGLALLFAPKKGSELREDLKCKINELVNKAKEVDLIRNRSANGGTPYRRGI